ncbi:MAG: hypothetical protein B6I38_07335 [Anaerolineaceae bacterium 4572_5.1]|nr:MAG: hypothetical protein B6I38_07335 [Anaerolineaceae bacterium 4572_5.1]
MDIPLKLLLLEDDSLDAELNIAALEGEGYQCDWQRVETKKDFLAELDNPDYEIILADYNLPSFDGMQALKLFVERGLDIPFILVSGKLGEDTAVEAVKAGATDYVLKDRLSRLAPSVKRALKEYEWRRKDRQRASDQALFRKLNQAANRGANIQELIAVLADKTPACFDCCSATAYLLSADQNYLEMQKATLPKAMKEQIEKLLKFSIPSVQLPVSLDTLYGRAIRSGETQHVDSAEGVQELIQAYIDAVPMPDKIKSYVERIKPQIQSLLGIASVGLIPLTDREKTIGLLEFSSRSSFSLEDIKRMENIAGQVTAILRRKQAEMEIARLAEVVRQASVAVAITNLEGDLVYVNPWFEETSGYSAAEVLGENPRVLKSNHHDKAFYRKLWDTITGGKTWHGALLNKRKDGSLYHEDASIFPIATSEGEIINYAAVKREITAEVEARQQIRQQLSRLEALHTIDIAISASMDLKLTVNVILEQTQNQLGADAVDLLTLNPALQSLKCVARRGFKTEALIHTQLRLGSGLAGKAALEREVVSVPDLGKDDEHFMVAPELKEEGFVAYWGVPLVAKGQVKGVLEIFHRTPREPDVEWYSFLNTLSGQAAIAIDNATLFEDLQKKNEELRLAYDTTLEGWAHALELRDMETEGHSRRVTRLTMELATAMGLDENARHHIRRGALLHDIGKMGIPDHILNKPGPLTDEEWDVMRKHPSYAYEMIESISFLRPAVDIPYSHHEKWDGSGYPLGIRGDAIPLPARIFAVIDVYDALRSDRSYRKAWSEEATLEHIREQSGKHFDPQVVEAFLEMMAEKRGS